MAACICFTMGFVFYVCVVYTALTYYRRAAQWAIRVVQLNGMDNKICKSVFEKWHVCFLLSRYTLQCFDITDEPKQLYNTLGITAQVSNTEGLQQHALQPQD